MSDYRTTPVPTDKMPPGIPYIVGNEAAERFSFYGMKAILTLYMAQYVLNADGSKGMPDAEAKTYFHLFEMCAYLLPMLGAIVADAFLGKYRTILTLSLFYCAGHLVMAFDETRWGLALGLGLIAVGAGGIKPCVSAHVGDQFGPQNQHLLERVYQWFYFSINLGACLSQLMIPRLRDKFGPQVAFAVPAFLMALATFVFWLGRNKFVHIPPGGTKFLKETFSREGLRVLGRLGLIYLFISIFWSIFDQTGSSWTLQATRMDRRWMGIDWLPDEIQAANPILVMCLVPLFGFVIYPAVNRLTNFTPLKKMSVGLFITAGAFALSAWIERQLDAGVKLNISWQLLAYVVLTSAEIMVSITSLEFSYTQAPPTMKSFVMALYLLSVSLGNALATVVNHQIETNPAVARQLHGENYYWFFTILMLIAAVGFIFVAWHYRGKTYVQQGTADETVPVADSRPQD